jgi:hypothetical protein
VFGKLQEWWVALCRCCDRDQYTTWLRLDVWPLEMVTKVIQVSEVANNADKKKEPTSFAKFFRPSISLHRLIAVTQSSPQVTWSSLSKAFVHQSGAGPTGCPRVRGEGGGGIIVESGGKGAGDGDGEGGGGSSDVAGIGGKDGALDSGGATEGAELLPVGGVDDDPEESESFSNACLGPWWDWSGSRTT